MNDEQHPFFTGWMLFPLAYQQRHSNKIMMNNHQSCLVVAG